MSVLPVDSLISGIRSTSAAAPARIVAGDVSSIPVGSLIQAVVLDVDRGTTRLDLGGKTPISVKLNADVKPGDILVVRSPGAPDRATPATSLEILGRAAPPETPSEAPGVTQNLVSTPKNVAVRSSDPQVVVQAQTGSVRTIRPDSPAAPVSVPTDGTVRSRAAADLGLRPASIASTAATEQTSENLIVTAQNELPTRPVRLAVVDVVDRKSDGRVEVQVDGDPRPRPAITDEPLQTGERRLFEVTETPKGVILKAPPATSPQLPIAVATAVLRALPPPDLGGNLQPLLGELETLLGPEAPTPTLKTFTASESSPKGQTPPVSPSEGEKGAVDERPLETPKNQPVLDRPAPPAARNFTVPTYVPLVATYAPAPRAPVVQEPSRPVVASVASPPQPAPESVKGPNFRAPVVSTSPTAPRERSGPTISPLPTTTLVTPQQPEVSRPIVPPATSPPEQPVLNRQSPETPPISGLLPTTEKLVVQDPAQKLPVESSKPEPQRAPTPVVSHSSTTRVTTPQLPARNSSPELRSAAETVRATIRTILPSTDRPPTAAELRELVDNGGLLYEAKLSKKSEETPIKERPPVENKERPAPEQTIKDSPPRVERHASSEHDLKGGLIRLLQAAHELGTAAPNLPAARATLDGIESQQAANTLAREQGAPYVLQIPFPDQGRLRTMQLSLEREEPDGHSGGSSGGKKSGSLRVLMHVPLTDLGETWIDAGMQGGDFRATLYVDQRAVDRVKAELPALKDELNREGFTGVGLDVRPTDDFPAQRRAKAAALRAGRGESTSLLDVRA